MKRSTISALVASSFLFVQALALAEEGKVAELADVPSDDRSARYSRSDIDPEQALAGNASIAKQAMRHFSAKGNAFAEKPTRGAVRMSPRADLFYIYDARATLRRDRDGDGYHSEFRLRFDADVRIGDALVYARLYLRRRGERDWFLYHETDDFWIFGQSGNDDYYVTTTLDAGFATAEYDVLIDLYEVGVSGIVATIGPADTGELAYLPLEEVGLDVPVEMPGFSIGEVYTDLLVDEDRDGFYSRFRITFDPDADFANRWVYARIWVRPRGGDWLEEFVTEDWLVETSGTRDAYVLEVDWISGYPTSYYDFQIDLFDAATDALIAFAGSERPELARVPLEDRSRDRAPSAPTTGGGGDSHSREGGGGALGIWTVLALLGVAAVRTGKRRSRGGRSHAARFL
jgi:hypothetical protein